MKVKQTPITAAKSERKKQNKQIWFKWNSSSSRNVNMTYLNAKASLLHFFLPIKTISKEGGGRRETLICYSSGALRFGDQMAIVTSHNVISIFSYPLMFVFIANQFDASLFSDSLNVFSLSLSKSHLLCASMFAYNEWTKLQCGCCCLMWASKVTPGCWAH